MRHLILSEDGTSLAPNAYHRLLAACNFPESVRDQQQGLFLAAVEKEEFDRVGRENYRPSEIMAATTRLAENRTAQVYLAGLVSFVFLWLAFRDQKPSLNRATIIVSCAANEFKHVEWTPAFDPEGKIRTKAATSDQASLERLFRQYRAVAHINAARVAASEFLAPLHLWEDAPVALNSFVQSCAVFQTIFEKVAEVQTWNLWDVKKHFPSALRDWPPLGIGNEIMQWVSVGFDLAIERGLIKRLR